MPHKFDEGSRSEELLLTGSEILRLTELAAIHDAKPSFEHEIVNSENEGGDELSRMISETIGFPE